MLTINYLKNSLEESFEKLNRSDAMDSNFLNLLVGLVYVAEITWLTLSKNQNAVVGNVGEESGELLLNLNLAFLWDFFISVFELSDYYA